MIQPKQNQPIKLTREKLVLTHLRPHLTKAGAAYRRVLYKEAVQASQEELRDRAVPGDLQQAIYMYQRNWWTEVQGVQVQGLLCDVPSTLRTEVRQTREWIVI